VSADASGSSAGAAGSGKSDRLTHIDSAGDARMVDVTEKPVSARQARATGFVEVSAQVVELLRGEGMPKGDALSVARIAGIMGAKKTSELVPLCHPIAISGVKVALQVEDAGVAIAATVKTADRTGVEMEALTAVAVAGLTVIDMVKAVDPAAVLTRVQVEAKAGGVSGDWSRPS
jgi:cyclic pyranopterin phosphate synthase